MFQRLRTSHFIEKSILGIIVLLTFSCQKLAQDVSWLDRVHEEGRQLFYQTIVQKITSHPKRHQLTQTEIQKIQEVKTTYERLYDLLMNIFYQKEEPILQELLESRSGKSRARFKRVYQGIVMLAAMNFVECFFETDEATEFIKSNLPKYNGLDAVDLVIRSIGYHSKLDSPDKKADIKPLSPEFDKQGALDAARFREAHKVTKGKGVRIAILDTGIDESHLIFTNTRWGKHFSLVGRTGKPWESDASLVDWGYHGTLISSIAARYAPEAQLTVYKFGDGDTQNDPAYQYLMQCMVAACIYKAVHDGNDIISISASGGSVDVKYLRGAIEYAHQNNRIVVSGNLYYRWYQHGFRRNFPGQYPTVISVTAAEKKENGSYGYWNICAPDSTTGVAAPNDIFAGFPTYIDEEDTYIPSISAAIPTVAALFAMTISAYPRLGTENPGEYADTVMNLVIENANPGIVGFEGFSPECGHGMIDAESTIKSAINLNDKRQGHNKQ